MQDFNADFLDIGIPEIDRQHRQVLHMIKSMGHAIGQPGERDVLRATILEMAAYSRDHFAYNAMVRDMTARFNAEDLDLSRQLVSFLWAWWTDHIQVHDRAWAVEYLAKNLRL
jgi:hemerythrin